eukprot:TRINITY_DN7263_c0_g1_i1.p1 TRINITY_DN7263_c0_g1~~TRINITY_DN7263_c0_g1_i1.p1  ORF type:complete len:403 (-),score=86.41 TRINITY_DN7263_c0_g1_i1:15-1223(-)
MNLSNIISNNKSDDNKNNDIRTQLLQDIIQKNNLLFKADEIMKSSKRILNNQKQNSSKKVKTSQNENVEYIHKIEQKLVTTKNKKLKMIINAKEKISNDYLKQILGIYKLHLRKIVLIGYYSLDDAIMGWFLQSFPYLESIKMRLKNNDMNISPKALYDFVMNSHSLYSLELYNPPASLNELYFESKSLRKLKLISLTQAKSIILKLENLKILMLDLKGNQVWKGSLEDLAASLANHCKNLVTLAISCPFVCDNDMSIVMEGCKKLEALSLHRSSFITDYLFSKLQFLSDLLYLDIQFCDSLTDECCDLISKFSKKLQSITIILSENARVTNKGVNSLSFINTLTRLKLKIPSIIVLSIFSKSIERLTLTDWDNLTYLSLSCPKLLDLNTKGCLSLMNIITF